MKKKKSTEERINNLKLIKNLNVFEASFGVTTALGMAYVSNNDEISSFILVPAGILCGVLFFHGISSYEKVKEKIIDLHQKKMLKDMEN